MARTVVGTAAALMLVLTLTTSAEEQRGGQLFVGIVGGRGASTTVLSRLDPETRDLYLGALQRRLDARPFTIPPEWDKSMEGPRADLAAALGALRPAAATEAADFAAHAVRLWGWEGEAAGPLLEAAHIEHYLARRPDSPLAEPLAVLLMLRCRAGYEAAQSQLATPSLEALRRADITTLRALAIACYLRAHARAREADPLVAALAADAHGGTFVYIDGQGHPAADTPPPAPDFAPFPPPHAP